MLRLCLKCAAGAVILISTTSCSSQIRTAKDDVRAELRDPASADFRNVHAGDVSGLVCGEVNARNGMGGYGGFQQFTWTEEGGVQWQPDSEDLALRIDRLARNIEIARPGEEQVIEQERRQVEFALNLFEIRLANFQRGCHFPDAD